MEAVIKLNQSVVGYGDFDSTGKFICKCGSTEFIMFGRELALGICFSCLKCGRTRDASGRECTRGGTEEPVHPVILLIEGVHDADLFKKYS